MVEAELVAIKVSHLLISIGFIIIIGVGLLIYMKKRNKS
ncbi:LPXTG cell wall anchor domain-containing protein [Clostridium sp.]|nr:LPXTG cell wall anchor domain-containing protein [Clostridium sp.]